MKPRVCPAWLDRAFRREQRKRRAALATEQAERRANPLPPPDPRLIQGGGLGAGYDGYFTEPLNLSARDIAPMKRAKQRKAVKR